MKKERKYRMVRSIDTGKKCRTYCGCTDTWRTDEWVNTPTRP